ncbi:MAG: hypothetical protein II433_09965 [Acidaminococcaceae bacterium]|nr:hypothetical protein [Acidaminococcaceae bacterium]
MAEDGSVIIVADVDDKAAQRELNSLAKKIDGLKTKIEQANTKKMPLIEQAKELGAELDAAKAKLAEMQAPNSNATSENISDQKENVRMLQAQWNEVNSQIERYDKTIGTANSQMELAENRAGELAGQLAGAGDAGAESGGQISAAMDAARRHVEKLERRIIGLAKRVFVFTLITKALRGVREYLWQGIKTNDEAVAAIARLKGALQTLAQPILQVVIPAFTWLINILARVVSAISAFVAILFGKSAKQNIQAAKSLNAESKAIKGVGGAAKEAAKSLASFDEINQLAGETAGSGGGAGGGAGSDPLFDLEDYKLPDWLEKLAGNLRINFKDVFFKWSDLTGEDIAKKIIAGLSALAGGVAGFAIGGIPGAILGTLAGCALGLIFDSLIFDNDGKISKEEALQMICLAAGALVGGVIGFSVGGAAGAGIGALVGASLGLYLSSLFFDDAGQITDRDALKSLVDALVIIAGAVIGFKVGGVFGAAIGATVGVGAALLLNKVIFGEGAATTPLLTSTLITALGVIGGGIIGFRLGGALGAAIGATIGLGMSITIQRALFSKGDRSLKSILMQTLLVALAGIAGAAIGFALGGPFGAAIGATIGVGITLVAQNIAWDSKSTAQINKIVKTAERNTTVPGKINTKYDLSKLPRMAEGGVIPPNREFMAVLGDQTSGTNIETPLSTMIEAFKAAMSETGGGATTVVVNLDGREIARNTVKHVNSMARAQGASGLLR